jgi:hypothetical protein
MKEPKTGEKYVHFKGESNIYEIIIVARDSDNPGKKLVVYKMLFDKPPYNNGTVWVRLLEDFCGDKEFAQDAEYNGKKFKKGDKIKRFTKIENE